MDYNSAAAISLVASYSEASWQHPAAYIDTWLFYCFLIVRAITACAGGDATSTEQYLTLTQYAAKFATEL